MQQNNSFKSSRLSSKARNKKAIYYKVINDIKKLADQEELRKKNKDVELTTDYALRPRYVF